MYLISLIRAIRGQIRKILFSLKGNKGRIKQLRSDGVKIGEGCLIYTNGFPSEPYLVEIGNHVALAGGTIFLTHDGSAWLLREKYPDLDIFGKIKIGDNTFVGVNCIILPNTEIGKNCIVGAGSVVRGKIPDNSVVMGNPAKIIMKTEIMEKLSLHNKNALSTKKMTLEKKTAYIKNHFNIV